MPKNSDKESLTKFQNLMQELFRTDYADLDFGINPILRQRKDRIERFIEKDMPEKVGENLDKIAQEEEKEIKNELEETEQEIVNTLGEESLDNGEIKEEHSSTPIAKRYKEQKQKLRSVQARETVKNRIFNNLYRFFSRYYEDGDFMAKRRYSGNNSKYSIPYNGQETMFYWSTEDQYYVKTGEEFKKYNFRKNGYKVDFELEEANLPKDNIKEDNRYFVVGDGDISYDDSSNNLVIPLQYRPLTEEEKQNYIEEYNSATNNSYSSFQKSNKIIPRVIYEKTLANVNDELQSVLEEEKDGQPLLLHHLKEYTSGNERDYFIHKDLDGFLSQELEVFIKNEVLNVSSLTSKDELDNSRQRVKAEAIRNIGNSVIRFLAQIEDFQRRLFEKKKFVYQTDYMVTLDYVPEHLYEDILAKKTQLEDWMETYQLDAKYEDIEDESDIDREFLEQNEGLMIDTAHFEQEFLWELLSSIDNLEQKIDGLAMNGENFQAMNLMENKYRNQVDCVYVDPPYNTGEDHFIFKDDFKDSSWLSMMSDRLNKSFELMKPSGTFLCHIDEHEFSQLHRLLNENFGSANNLGEIVWDKKNPKGDSRAVATQHEYILSWTNDKEKFDEKNSFVKPKKNAERMMDKASELFQKVEDDEISLKEANSKFQDWIKEQNELSGGEEAYKYIDQNGDIYRPTSMAWPNKDEAPDDYKMDLIHPETGEKCKRPKRDWRFPSSTLEDMLDGDEYKIGKHIIKGEVIFKQDHTSIPNKKTFLKDNVVENIPSIISYGGSADNLFDSLNLEFDNNPKPLEVSSKLLIPPLKLTDPEHNSNNPLLMDFFAGSGTAGHTAIELQREFGMDNDYILIELGDHFDTVLRPRIQKEVFSTEWKDGVPQNSDSISHIVKYQRIESYEDSLNNIRLREVSDSSQTTLDEKIPDYFEGYLLDMESRGSKSLVSDAAFKKPFDYNLEIHEGMRDSEEKSMDLIETFHYLLGVEVNSYWHGEHQERKYVVTRGRIESSGEEILTVWRDREGVDLGKEAEWFKDRFETSEVDKIYVNGESDLPKKEITGIKFRNLMRANK